MSNKTNAFRESFFRNNYINERDYYNAKRFDLIDSDPGIKGIPMIFITTPAINLATYNTDRDGFFSYLATHDPSLLTSLSYQTNNRPFIPLLSNRMSEFTVADHSIQTRETSETHYGFVQNLPLYAPSADTTNVSFVDNANLDVLKLHKAWFDYVIYVTRGIMTPTPDAVTERYLDYTSSIYHFVLAMDGETIQYYDKMTGCFPTTVPYSEFSSKMGSNQELVEYSIEYAYSYREYMTPSILVDFNTISSDDGRNSTESSYIAANDRYSNADPKDRDLYTTTDMTTLRRPRIVRSGSNFKLLFIN